MFRDDTFGVWCKEILWRVKLFWVIVIFDVVLFDSTVKGSVLFEVVFVAFAFVAGRVIFFFDKTFSSSIFFGTNFSSSIFFGTTFFSSIFFGTTFFFSILCFCYTLWTFLGIIFLFLTSFVFLFTFFFKIGLILDFKWTFFKVFLAGFSNFLAKRLYFLTDFFKTFGLLFNLLKEVAFLAGEIDYDSN